MKKLLAICVVAILFAFNPTGISAQTSAYKYKADSSIDVMDGRVYYRTDCEDKIGDDCNMPGSSHRTDMGTVPQYLAGILIRL